MNRRGFTIVELLIVIVVIAILAALTVVAFNGITNQAKNSARAADLKQWKKKSEAHKVENSIECPPNYAFVYGNSTLGTNDFCVMKYEAKNVGGVPTSQASGTPWVSITQPNAIIASQAAGGHLLTEAEWMTIAADVLSVKYNWSETEVGSGYVYQGHVNNGPDAALAASDDDSDALYGITDGTGDTPGTNSSRVLWLTSGDAIWDFSGNVWEWTSQQQAMNQVGVPGDSGFVWREWTRTVLSLGNLPTASIPDTLATVEGLEDITNWNSDQGVGKLYANYSDTATRVFRRGGNWNNMNDAGVLTLHLDRPPTNSNGFIGFRVAQ